MREKKRYRPTYDVDACWTDTTKQERRRAVQTITKALETHLERIARHRQIEEITDEQQRRDAQSLRAWFRERFLNVPEK